MGFHRVLNIDCISYKKHEKYRDVDLGFMDPPFNMNRNYDVHDDDMEPNEFKTWLKDRISLTSFCIRQNGTLCLHGPDKLCMIYLEWLSQTKVWELSAWVNLYYGFGQCRRTNWVDARTHLIVLNRLGADPTWNPDDVLVPSLRATKYKDKRIHDTERGGKRLPGTVWGIPEIDGPGWGRVQGTSSQKRKGHDNQLPEKYLERIIKAYSNPKDVVYDPFGGSGTTSAVAKKLGRNSITCEISPKYCKSIKRRLEEIDV
jgi:DNA modification methylase